MGYQLNAEQMLVSRPGITEGPKNTMGASSSSTGAAHFNLELFTVSADGTQQNKPPFKKSLFDLQHERWYAAKAAQGDHQVLGLVKSLPYSQVMPTRHSNLASHLLRDGSGGTGRLREAGVEQVHSQIMRKRHIKHRPYLLRDGSGETGRLRGPGGE